MPLDGTVEHLRLVEIELFQSLVSLFLAQAIGGICLRHRNCRRKGTLANQTWIGIAENINLLFSG